MGGGEQLLKVCFYDSAKDSLIEFAVIVSKYNGKWVFCKHKEGNAFECPGGHREKGEKIEETARRELWEETGGINYNLHPICVYSVVKEIEETFGMLYFAEIYEVEKLPSHEIEKIELFDDLPTQWTYPQIQPLLLKHAEKINNIL
ncbi:MAG: NUDIX domain-containing protein [Angelakisella sp.]|nr:NUDIX domain-containing protein [Angelakisella sp.]